MSKYSILLLVTIFSFTIMCSKKSGVEYTNKKYSFSITFAKKWQLKENQYGSLVAAVNEESTHTTKENITVIADNKMKPINEYIKDIINSVKRSKELKAIIKNPKNFVIKDVTVAKKPAKLLQYEYTSKLHNDKLLIQTYVIELEKIFLLITGVTTVPASKKFKQQLQQAIATLKVK